MPKEGTAEPTLDIPIYPVYTFPNGATALLRNRYPWGKNDKGEPQTRLILYPYKDFKHMYGIRDQELKYGTYIEFILPTKHIIPLNEDPTNARYLVTYDYRTKEEKTINAELRASQIRLETAETIIHEQNIELTKIKQEYAEVVEEGKDWEPVADMVAEKVFNKIMEVMFKRTQPTETPY